MKQIYALLLLGLFTLTGTAQTCGEEVFDLPQYVTIDWLKLKCFKNTTPSLSLNIDSNGDVVTSPLLSLTTTGSGTATYNTSTRVLNVPTPKSSAPFSGTTGGAGTYTVTFPSAYSVAPNVQANIINGTDTQNIRITAVSTTGCTVLVRNRVDVVGLLPTWNNVSGANVDILVTAK